ncbi:MAG: methionyl-tRNA formyltransferase [Bacteroidetes bacterium]|nr:methionyl-tRNA formyltransferase [Bacteroidota bacterium]
MRIIFYGTPDFAVPSLQILVENNFNVVAVVTAADSPAGRGLQMKFSPVKEYALSQNIKVLQPHKLKDPAFLEEIKSLMPDLQIVVAFRMMPQVLWSMPPLGSFNLHGSLLPQYRGAAPINWAIINGEKETGVTTFFLQQEIDTGNIIFQEKIPIEDRDNATTLHNKMMHIGAALVLKTARAISNGKVNTTPQSKVDTNELKAAPKIFKETCAINFNNEVDKVNNFVRGLSRYPAAYTYIVSKDNERLQLKIYSAQKEYGEMNVAAGNMQTDGKTFLKFACNNGWLHALELQLQGKKAMTVQEFLRGFIFQNTNA